MKIKLFPFMALFLVIIAIFTIVCVPSTRAYDTAKDPWQQDGSQKIYDQAKEIQQKQNPIEFYPSSNSQTKTTLIILAVTAISIIIIIKLFVNKKNKSMEKISTSRENQEQYAEQ